MVIDRNKKYFFHNIYGNEEALLASLPTDVVAVPAGWDNAAESNRNDVITSLFQDGGSNLNVGYATLPDVLVWRPGFTETVEGEVLTYVDGWVAVGLPNFVSTDTWADINILVAAVPDGT
jgi:hypothetical protein